MLRLRALILFMFCAMVCSALWIGCGGGSDNPVTPPATNAEYFPFSRNYLWSYRTNVFASNGVPDTVIQMKIDTASYRTSEGNKLYSWLFIRIPDSPLNWTHFMVLLDSANTIYSWGDFPNAGAPFALPWRHQYSASEGTRETITVQGKSYNAVRVDMTGENNVKISWWFADGIGLIKEYSSQGGSIFTDNVWGSTVEMVTELITYTR